MLRNVSTYRAATLRTSQFEERRATPTTTPMIVASTIPSSATLIVFWTPTTNASQRLCVERKSESGIANPAGCFR